jgi:hypothetical protein
VRLKAVQGILLFSSLACLGLSLALTILLDWIGSKIPDPASGRIYPLFNHREIYAFVTPAWGNAAFLAICGAFVFGAIFFALKLMEWLNVFDTGETDAKN